MFNKLPSSTGDRFGWLKHPWVIGISIAAHVALVAGFMWLANVDDAEAAEEEINPEDITYIDVSEIPPPPEVEEPEPEPEPEPETPQPRTPEPVQQAPRPTPPRQPRVTPPAVTAPERPAGFQELRPPREAIGVPPPTQAPPVRAEDFGGRGEAGGVAGGNPPPPAPPAPPASGGTGTGGSGSGVDPNQTYTASAVDRIAEVRNRNDVAVAMRRLYPSHLRDADIGGRVTAQFVVDASGNVVAGSIRIINAAHPDLGEQTRRALSDIRFRPARKGNTNVRQLVQMAIDWQPAN